MTAKTQFIEGLNKFDFDTKIDMIDKVLTHNGKSAAISEVEPGVFKVSGLEDDFKIFDGDVTAENIDEALSFVMDKCSKGMNCPTTALMLVHAILD